MRVWNKPLREITGKDLFKLYLIYTFLKGIDRGFSRTTTAQQLSNWTKGKREEDSQDL